MSEASKRDVMGWRNKNALSPAKRSEWSTLQAAVVDAAMARHRFDETFEAWAFSDACDALLDFENEHGLIPDSGEGK